MYISATNDYVLVVVEMSAMRVVYESVFVSLILLMLEIIGVHGFRNIFTPYYVYVCCVEMYILVMNDFRLVILEMSTL